MWIQKEIEPTFTAMAICAYQDEGIYPKGASKTFTCKEGVQGRYLVVMQNKTGKLVMCEVEAYKCESCERSAYLKDTIVMYEFTALDGI